MMFIVVIARENFRIIVPSINFIGFFSSLSITGYFNSTLTHHNALFNLTLINYAEGSRSGVKGEVPLLFYLKNYPCTGGYNPTIHCNNKCEIQGAIAEISRRFRSASASCERGLKTLRRDQCSLPRGGGNATSGNYRSAGAPDVHTLRHLRSPFDLPSHRRPS